MGKSTTILVGRKRAAGDRFIDAMRFSSSWRRRRRRFHIHFIRSSSSSSRKRTRTPSSLACHLPQGESRHPGRGGRERNNIATWLRLIKYNKTGVGKVSKCFGSDLIPHPPLLTRFYWILMSRGFHSWAIIANDCDANNCRLWAIEYNYKSMVQRYHRISYPDHGSEFKHQRHSSSHSTH